ncbi:MAG: beta-ketoacyl synthase chain length factor [Proteobacteria bacterium]|nr:beta-ketoacyl synthase chain length factor [Pseudomonadota bacterium]
MRWTLPITHWTSWNIDTTSSDQGAEPKPVDFSFVDPLLRRRLSQLARMSLKVAHDCSRDLPRMHFVYASRHGELKRTTDMLSDLAAGETLSPTAFSLSVLNASAGIFSMLRHDTAPATAISAGASTFGFGLLEAGLQLAAKPNIPVLFVYADEPAPAVYGGVAADTGPAHAVAVLLSCDAPLRIICNVLHFTASDSSEPQSATFLRCIEGNATASSTWRGEGRTWTWHRDGVPA